MHILLLQQLQMAGKAFWADAGGGRSIRGYMMVLQNDQLSVGGETEQHTEQNERKRKLNHEYRCLSR